MLTHVVHTSMKYMRRLTRFYRRLTVSYTPQISRTTLIDIKVPTNRIGFASFEFRYLVTSAYSEVRALWGQPYEPRAGTSHRRRAACSGKVSAYTCYSEALTARPAKIALQETPGDGRPSATLIADCPSFSPVRRATIVGPQAHRSQFPGVVKMG